MGKKNKKKNKKSRLPQGAPSTGAGGDDAALAEAAALNAAASATAAVAAEGVKVEMAAEGDAPAAAAELDEEAAFLASLGGGAGGGGKKKKKKKKKSKAERAAKAGGDDAGDGKPKKKKMSAAAKAAQERLAKVKAAEEEQARIAAEAKAAADAEEAKLKAIEDARAEKARKKREKAQAKKERQKAEGTYMTKKQKQKLARSQAALARFGMPAPGGNNSDGNKKRGGASMFRRKKNKKKNSPQKDEAAPAPAPAVEEVAAPAPAEKVEAAADDWEAADDAATKKKEEENEQDDDAGDDWDAGGDDDWEAGMSLNLDKPMFQGSDEEDEDETVAELKRQEEKKRKEKEAAAAAAKAKAAAKKPGKGKKKKKLTQKEKRRLAEEEAKKARASGKRIPRRAPLKMTDEQKTKASRERRRVMLRDAKKVRSEKNLRSPICCVMGHVDTGKTKLLDKIRRTNVQEGEAGGITQQIGATFFPIETVKRKVEELNEDFNLEIKLPGLLMIDTPGHESFTNLRSRGSSICDIAILVVDIMHGLEPQTIESLNLLKKNKTPFIVALNKVDRLYGWKVCPDSHIRASLSEQTTAMDEFEQRVKETKLAFMEQGLNTELYFENSDHKRNISLVPTSAHTGEGVPDLLLLLMQLTQVHMAKKMMWCNYVECVVLEVKVIEGLGTTVDVILINGTLRTGDTIVLCGLNGPIVTQVRALLTPAPMKELRVKNDYIKHDVIEQAMGIKIAAQDVDKVVAGTQIMVLHPEDDRHHIESEVMEALSQVESLLQKTGRGVYVQASTLGSLEALLEFLRTLKPPIPVAGFNIGPVHKKDVLMASIMLEHQREFATILAFDVKVNAEARQEAANLGVKIFTADIIYHLFDMFTKYMDDINAARRGDAATKVVFPCELSIIPEYIFNKKNPIVLGVKVDAGVVKIGTPLCIIKAATEEEEAKILKIGRIASIEKNNATQETARTGDEVCVKIEQGAETDYIMYGRQFDHTNKIYSRVTRESIDLLKESFKEEMTTPDWHLVVKLKQVLGVL